MTTDRAGIKPNNLEQIGKCTVLRNIMDQPGVFTIEGTLIPLLPGEQIKSHMIKMHAGQYCDAHPHATESQIYTLSGRWIFATIEDGETKRTVINQGDMFHFPGGEPTGFEVPWDEDAVILIVKSGSDSYDDMVDGMSQAKSMLDTEAANGTPFFYHELPEDHPARIYAAEVTGEDPARLGV